MIGRELAHYRIVDRLGSGGMGDVYLAEDMKLGREVAIKTLPADFAENEDRLARFTREARTLAGLSHANIATLHGIEEVEGVRFLVMECVPGETLEERIRRGPIPLEQALPLLLQTAEALEAAHQKGVIHRDLKPANIKVMPEGVVKVLDFGLAKVLKEEDTGSDSSQIETRAKEGTQAGVILGTAPYMSPEQARGKPVDKRTDIWAFGCLCFEALTGRKAFDGETVTDAITSVIHMEPDWERLPKATPKALRKLIRRCLEKEPRRRLHDIADARTEIEELLNDPLGSLDELETVDPRARSSKAVAAIAVLLGAALGAGVASNLGVEPTLPVVRVSVPVDPDMRVGGLTNGVYHNPLAISPDGQTLVYVAQDDVPQLYLRDLDQLEARPLTGTEGATSPFFSPDGEWLGFFLKDELRKISLAGGAPQTLCDVPFEIFRAAIWGPNEIILYSAARSGIMQVSSNGGEPERLTSPDPETGASFHAPLQFLSGSEVLFQLGRRLAVLDIATRTWEPIDGLAGWDGRDIERPSTRYLSSGHLVYAQSTAGDTSQLLAVPLDLARREATGAAVPVLEGVHSPQTYPFVAISESGTLAYVPSREQSAELVRVDRSGNATPLAVEWPYADPFSDAHPRFSPDGNLVAVDLKTDEGKDIWTIDERGTKTRLTFGGDHTLPTWTPDGARITVADRHNLRWFSADGIGGLEPLWDDPAWQWPNSWTPAGDALAFFELNPETNSIDIGILPLDGDGPTKWLETDYNEIGPKFSPDGRFLAYASDESGRNEVYVRSFPGKQSKTLVSVNGGTEPAWTSNGREMLYRRGRQMMRVDVTLSPEFSASEPELLFEGDFDLAPFGEQHYDVSPDGSQFVMVRLNALPRVNVTIHWMEDLKRVLPIAN